jgi:hypothetical protein
MAVIQKSVWLEDDVYFSHGKLAGMAVTQKSVWLEDDVHFRHGSISTPFGSVL